MIANEKLEEINSLLLELEDTHLLAGPMYQKVHACKALMASDETEVIHYLTETHSPGLRNKTVYRYEQLLANKPSSDENTAILELCKDILITKCSTYPKEKKIEDMLHQIEDMPKEWTIVQLTPQFNPAEIWNEDKDIYYTNSIHISVFDCGQKEKPFMVTANAPRDAITGQIIEMCKEITLIIKLNKEILSSFASTKFKNHKEKHEYYSNLRANEDRLSLLIKDMQNLWLKEWRCLLTGKFCNENLENEIRLQLKEFCKSQVANLEITKKIETILCCIVKNPMHLKMGEVKKVIEHCFPNADKSVIKNIGSFTRTIGQKLSNDISKEKRHPVILILHDSLDFFPWEMIDVLEKQPACRMPSLHFLYCLFKQHENEIVNGYKIIKDSDKGSYVVNPSLDLKPMEVRMMAFFNYWTPNWIGISGCEPTKDTFFEYLTTSNILSYNGHGSGSTYIPMDKLQKSHVKAIVLLFGCGSAKITRTDPQIEMFGNYYTYLIARCPCVVGMLWEVTDKATDLLSTNFMSYWIPSKASKHWKYVHKPTWQKGEQTLVFNKDETILEEPLWEPDLLRALLLAKNTLPNLMSKAACVVRGLPVEIRI